MSEQLLWSIKNGDLDQVREIVEKKGINVDDLVDGRSLIVEASDYGQIEMIQYLVEKGANVNACDKHGISPLLAAIWEGHSACVKLLIQQGASRSGTTPDGTSYLEAAEKEEIRALLK